MRSRFGPRHVDACAPCRVVSSGGPMSFFSPLTWPSRVSLRVCFVLATCGRDPHAHAHAHAHGFIHSFIHGLLRGSTLQSSPVQVRRETRRRNPPHFIINGRKHLKKIEGWLDGDQLHKQRNRKKDNIDDDDLRNGRIIFSPRDLFIFIYGN